MYIIYIFHRKIVYTYSNLLPLTNFTGNPSEYNQHQPTTKEATFTGVSFEKRGQIPPVNMASWEIPWKSPYVNEGFIGKSMNWLF